MMSATSVGQIGLDLVVNKKSFDKQMNGIQGLAKKAGLALAGAFAVKKLISFGQECINLGSDLAEVQNVVDVVFPHMADRIDEFAKSAAASFGLSETMAKKYSGLYGSMAKAFGFTESQAYDMSTALTGLAGDVASFYNLDQDLAYTKLKSVFSGETETLKDLGIVMTQNALDAYAMANGYGKVTKDMTEAEKVSLRFAFVQEQLAAATGDFARTSGSWANQTKILSLQFDSLKASIGQGLINLFTPILKVVNTLIGKLATLANAFKSFTELITGNKSSGASSIANTAEAAGEGLSDAAASADELASSTDGVGSAAKKAAKAMAALMGFDQINKLADPSDDTDSGSGSGSTLGDAVDFGSLAQGDTVLDETNSKFQALIDRAKELGQLFAKGFTIGFGDSGKRIDEIKEHVSGIGSSLKEIFTDPAIVSGFNKVLDAIAFNWGKFAGSVASIGVTIATNLIGGIDKYLQKSKDYIKQRLVKIFDARADILNMFGDLCVDIADIFSVFANDDGKTITASIIGIFSDSFLGLTEIIDRDVRNVMSVVAGVISENKDKIKTAIENTLAPLAEIASKIHGIFTDTFSKISEVYDTYIDPAFVRIKDGFSTVFGAALDAYNNYLAPVLDWIADRFSILVDQYIQPLIDAFLELWGKATEALSIFWEFISPFVAWFIEVFIAEIAKKLQWLWTVFEYVFSAIAAVITGIIEIFSGLIDFIVGIFTGDWKKAWDGIKKIFEGVWTAISGVVEAAWNFISNVVKTVLDTIKNTISTVLDGISTFMSGIWTTLKNVAQTAWDAIKGFIVNPIEAAKETITGVLDFMKDKFTSIFNGIKDAVRTPLNAIIGFFNGLIKGAASAVNSVAKMLNNLSFTIPDWVPGIGGKTLGFNLPMWTPGQIPMLANGGYVKANTPQLAMIGDNRHQGEVVAPEDKLRQMAIEAAKMAGGGGGLSGEIVALLKEIIKILKDLNIVILDEESLRKWFIEKTNANTIAYGVSELLG